MSTSANLATRCPGCGTALRVLTAQLSARGGRVRCGKCNTVFDGIAQLVDQPPTADSAGPSPQLGLFEASQRRSTRSSLIALITEPAAPSGDRTREESSAVEHHDPAPLEPAPDEAAEQPQERQATPIDMRAGEETLLEAAETLVEDPAPAAAEVIPEAAFLREKPRRTRLGVVWGVLAVAALAGLATQAAFRFRSELAVLVPAVRPYLEEACVPLGCTVGLPRHADLLVIESSDLQADARRANVIQLNAVLRNRAPYPQAFPWLELTLSDDAGQPYVRRVLAPTDYLNDGRDAVRSGIAARGESAVRVDFDTSQVRATAYKLFVFYP